MTTARRLGVARALVLGLATVALMGCDTIGASMLQTTFPAQGDGVQEFRVAPLPVTFWDRTGLVTAIEPISLDPELDPLSGLYAVPGLPNELVARWMGGACEDHVTVTLREEADHLAMTVDSSMSLLTWGCVDLGVLRDLRVTFSREISPDEVVLTELH